MDFETKLAMRLLGKIPEDQIKTVLGEVKLLQHDYDISTKPHDLIRSEDVYEECYKAYFVSKKIEGKSPETIKSYKLAIDNMLMGINKPVGKITANDLRVYLYEYQQRRKVSNRTLDCLRLIFSSFFSWVHAEGYIPANPCVNLASIKYTPVVRQPLTEMQLELVRAACRDARECAIIEALYSSGCRVSELKNINISDIDFETGTVKIFGKGAKLRTGYLSARAIVCLKRYLSSRSDNNPALFVSLRKPHGRLSKESIEKIVRNVGERANIGRPIHPHLMRHTMATAFLERSGNIADLKTLLGHSKLDTTMIYAKVNQQEVSRAHRLFII